MTLPLLVLFQSFIFIFGVLGLRFFRKAKHNFMWVLSALPFAIDSGLLITYYLRPSALPDFSSAPGYELPRALATLLCVVAIALYMFTLGTHREALPAGTSRKTSPGTGDLGALPPDSSPVLFVLRPSSSPGACCWLLLGRCY